MSTILDSIAEYARERVRRDREVCPLEKIKALCGELPVTNERPFESAVKRPGMSFICEVKKASPSRGVIAENFPYTDIAREYEDAGADCISCLTEPKWFLGSDDIFREIRASVTLPMLRKDFVVDEYQIYQARLMGADAVLLICAILDKKTLAGYLELCEELGMSALVEAHNEDEIRTAVELKAGIIGVNNRNLNDFSVDMSNSVRLRSLVPESAAFVAESGIKTPEDVKRLRILRADAALIGETLMRAKNKKETLDALAGRI